MVWYQRWERETREAAEAKGPIPRLTEIKLPWLLDKTPDLLKMHIEDAKKKKAWDEKAREEEIRRRFS